MLKKATRIFVSLSLILSISAFASINVSAGTVVTAGASSYEIAQDFEGIAAGTTLTSAFNPAQETAQLMEGPGAIAGDKCLQINVISPGGYSKIDLAASILPKPTLAAPTGIFFRVEFDKPVETGVGGTMITTLDGSYDGMQTAWVTDMAGANGYFGTYGGFKGMIIGYIFVPFPNANWTTDKILGWDMRSNLPSNSKMLLDNLGYYKGTDYAAIIESLNAADPLNPIALQGVTPNTYKNNIIPNNPIQMQIQAYHKGASTILWSVKDPVIASIDANGLITAKKKGSTVVTASLSNDPTVKQECTINVVLGDIDLTSRELDNAHTAVFGLKVKFRASARYYTFDKDVVWSVKSGPATFVPAAFDPLGDDSDIATAPDVTCILASFSDSGKVIFRATLAANPTIFTDYELTILPSFTQLQSDVLNAMGMNTNQYSQASWGKVQTLINTINTLIENGPEKTTQSKINTLRTDLAKAIAALVVGQGTESEPDDDNGNPQTGSESLVILTLTVILLGGLIITFKKRIPNN
ncbi:MAG: Ig-like domain-containing protein [Saccharofermentanales bacterium]